MAGFFSWRPEVMTKLRSPCVAVLGHVDAGKTSLLDRIRNSQVAAAEPGAITQCVGASEVPAEYLKKHCGTLLARFKITLDIPGLLFIDTPGHKAFSNLRKRGGGLADIAVLVIDVLQGFQPQTLECIKILKHNKTPFIVAANKLDRIQGWSAGECFLENVGKQEKDVVFALDQKIYKLAGELSGQGFDSDRYDRVNDFTKQVAIVPISAKTGEGVSDLLAMIAGMAQRYLSDNLKTTTETKGTVLEVNRDKKLGTTIDVIIYDGTLKVGDAFAVGGVNGPIVSKVRALLKPKSLVEIKEAAGCTSVRAVEAAAGVKIVAPGLEEAISGSPLVVGAGAKEKVVAELEELKIPTQPLGLIIKTDSFGGLEALASMLEEAKLPIRLGDIGPVMRGDVLAAEDVGRTDELLGVVIAFNVAVPEDVAAVAEAKKIRILQGEVIYQIIEDYKKFLEEKKEEKKKQLLDSLTRPAKFTILPGYVFRQSKPAVVGVEVTSGILKPDVNLMKGDGMRLGTLKQVQQEGKTVASVERGKRCAVAIDGPTVGRQINENDVLYVVLPEQDFFKLKELEKLLNEDEKATLAEIQAIMRAEKPTWGMKW